MSSVKEELGTGNGVGSGSGVGPILFVIFPEVFKLGTRVGVRVLSENFHPFLAEELVYVRWVGRAVARFRVSNC